MTMFDYFRRFVQDKWLSGGAKVIPFLVSRCVYRGESNKSLRGSGFVQVQEKLQQKKVNCCQPWLKSSHVEIKFRGNDDTASHVSPYFINVLMKRRNFVYK